MHDNNTTEIDTEGMERAAKAVREFGEAVSSFQEAEERRGRYFWKSFPHIWNDERLKQATIRRERERKSELR